MAELELATLKPYVTLSGYAYIYLPKQVFKACNITPMTTFKAVWCDGQLIIRQEVNSCPNPGT